MVSQVLNEMTFEEYRGWIAYKHMLAQDQRKKSNVQSVRDRAKQTLKGK